MRRPANHAHVKAALLAVTAACLLFFQGSTLLYLLAVIVASIIGLLDLFRMVWRPVTIRFCVVLAVGILLGYGLGSAIYLISNQSIDSTQFQYWALFGLLFNQEGLSFALSACLIAAAILYLCGDFERPIYSTTWLKHFDETRSEIPVWLGVAATILALYAGDIGYMGAFVSTTNNISPLGALDKLILPPLAPYLVLLITGNRSARKKVVLLIALLFVFGVLFVIGRRNLLYALVLSGVAWRMREGTAATRRAALSAGFAVVAGTILYWGFNFFMALRLSVAQLGREAGLMDLMQSALANLTDARATVVQQALAENVGSRPFILSYFGGLAGISNGNTPTLGSEFLYAVQTCIPSILLPWKASSLPPSPEYLIHPLYGLPVFDGPNSILVAGFDDFGYVGAVIYPMLLAMLYCWYYSAYRSTRDATIKLFVAFALMFQLLYIEQDLSESFVILRNLIIIFFVIFVAGRAYDLISPPTSRYPNKRSSISGSRWNRHVPLKAADILLANEVPLIRENAFGAHRADPD
jgi:hypothetical protein